MNSYYSQRNLVTMKIIFILICTLFISRSVKAQSVIVNPDGTHSVLMGTGSTQILVNSDGTHSTVIDNGGATKTVVNPNGTHSIIIDNGGNTKTIVNPNGSHTTVIAIGATKTIINPVENDLFKKRLLNKNDPLAICLKYFYLFL